MGSTRAEPHARGVSRWGWLRLLSSLRDSWAAQEPQMRTMGSKPHSKSGMLLVKRRAAGAWSASWGHRAQRRTATATMAVECPLRRCQVESRALSPHPETSSIRSLERNDETEVAVLFSFPRGSLRMS